MGTQVIAVANQKGGVGKTTTSINLAACLAELEQRVLLIDVDPQANATSGLGVEKQEGRSIYSALLGESTLAEHIVSTVLERLDLLPAEVDLAGAEVDIARTDNYLHPFKTALQPVLASQRYDYVIIDCPPSLGILTMNVLTAADSLLIPMQCEYYALEGLSVMLRLVERLKDSGANPDLHIRGIVMTMYDMRTNLSQQVVQEVARYFGDHVYETLIPRSVRLGEAPSYGQPILRYDASGIGTAAYRSLAREVVAQAKNGYLPPADTPAEASESVPVSVENEAE
jgi:chromosome partitioning protein